ncbi:unnamed protein product, partial [Porites lobata]
MEVKNPEELMKVLLDNPSATSQLNSFVEQAIAKSRSPAPSKVVPLEKSDKEVRKALEREELSNEEIKELGGKMAPVEAKEVVVYDSGDEDTCSDLLLKRKISLERVRKTARENELRGSRLLALLIGYKAPSQQMSVKDLMELAKENVTVPSAKVSSASLTPLKCCTTSTADAALRAQQKRGRLALA